jgi:hypothetical protein
VADSASVEVIFNSAGTKTAGDTETKVGKIDLTNLNVTENDTGVYRYTLTQTTKGKNTLGTDNDYADDEDIATEYQVDLYVNSGKIIAVKVRTPDGSKKSEPIFENTVTNLDKLYVTHYIDSEMKKDGETFEFQITIPEGGVEGGITLNAGTLIYGEITNVYDETKNRTITFFVPATPAEGEDYATTYTDADGNEYSNVFNLYDGDELVIPGLPAGMLYYISMNNANRDGYESKYYDYANFTGTASSSHKAWSENTPIDAETTTSTTLGGSMKGTEYTNSLDHVHHVEFVSTKGISNTGISMDSVPYLVMFVAAAAIAVLAVAKKKTDR